MPTISDYKCDKCDFVIDRGWGGFMYVEDDSGIRQVCPHPAEVSAISKTLHLDREIVNAWLADKNAELDEKTKELLESRVGFQSKCVCFDCATIFDLDLDKDERRCPKCHRESIKSAKEAVGQQCPKCHSGVTQLADTGIIS